MRKTIPTSRTPAIASTALVMVSADHMVVDTIARPAAPAAESNVRRKSKTSSPWNATPSVKR
ncbi:Uncharacterised protein [Mycobacterium tuberculosis]|nr:Uncharacterised protein [Mycobacterium tuberculosis]